MTMISKAMCAVFGHQYKKFEYTDKYRRQCWHYECERCGDVK